MSGHHTVRVVRGDLSAELAVAFRQLLTAATTLLDGSIAAPNSVRRNRDILNALEYAVQCAVN